MSLGSMFHIGQPVIQFLVIFMIVSVFVMTSKYFKVKTFQQVVACEKPGSVYGLNIQVGRNETVTIKNQESIHKILIALEETTFLPSLMESSVLTKTSIVGREINLEFLGMVEMDAVTISSRGVLYNNSNGQAYELSNDEVYQMIIGLTMTDDSI